LGKISFPKLSQFGVIIKDNRHGKGITGVPLVSAEELEWPATIPSDMENLHPLHRQVGWIIGQTTTTGVGN
jgi:hypothetical protein